MEQASSYISDTTTESVNIAQISHEIRNPLTLINCTLQLLDCRYPQLKDDDLWNQLIGDVDYLRQLMLSLSDLNRCGHINLAPVNMNQMIRGIARQYLVLAQKEEKHLSVILQNELPVITCDELKIHQALVNLIKNAFEATKPWDTIEIFAKSTAQRLIIAIKDTGKGIPQDSLSKIFQPFVTQKQDGTGLGLSITKKIIEAHKGTIRVYSREGIGTKFIVSLPIVQK